MTQSYSSIYSRSQRVGALRAMADALNSTFVWGGAEHSTTTACSRCGDPGHFIDRCPMMEVKTMIWVPDVPWAAPNQAGWYQVPESIKGGTYQALVDLGCNQTSIHQSLIHIL